MKYFDFGQQNEKLMVMLHGGGVCYKGVLPVAEQLSKDFHVNCFFFTGLFYIMMGKAGPMRKRFLARITGRTVEEADRLLYQQATWRSWKNQDYCLINRPIDFNVFKRTDMHIWHGINSSVEKKLARDIRKWQDAGYAFTYKAFHDVGHGGLAGEHTDRFMEEVKAAHQLSLAKQEATHLG